MYSDHELQQACTRVLSRVKHLQTHQDTPAHFRVLLDQCVTDLQTVRECHEQSKQQQLQAQKKILHHAIYSRSPFQVN